MEAAGGFMPSFSNRLNTNAFFVSMPTNNAYKTKETATLVVQRMSFNLLLVPAWIISPIGRIIKLKRIKKLERKRKFELIENKIIPAKRRMIPKTRGTKTNSIIKIKRMS